MRQIAQMLYTACMTRLRSRCYNREKEIIQESVLKDVNQRGFHVQKTVMKRLKKKTKQKTTC